MNISDRISAAKPYVIGGVLGAAGLAIIGFSANWVVTTGTLAQQVEQAKVNILAEVCEKNAIRAWEERGQKIAALEGWGNEDREKLAQQYAPRLPNDKNWHDEVVDRCDDLLRPA